MIASLHKWMIHAEDELCHFLADKAVGSLAFGEQPAQ
jgi:hypothetical protein